MSCQRCSVPPDPHLSALAQIAAERFGMTVEELRVRDRHPDTVRVRDVAVYVLWTMTDATLDVIGASLDRNHSSVSDALRRARLLLEWDRHLQWDVAAITERIGVRP